MWKHACHPLRGVQQFILCPARSTRKVPNVRSGSRQVSHKQHDRSIDAAAWAGGWISLDALAFLLFHP